jgi:hypothetical protein
VTATRAAIAWSPDGRRLLALHAGSLEIRALDGARVRAISPSVAANATFADARWLEDGRIATVDSFGIPGMFSLRGEPYGDIPGPGRYAFAPTFLALAGGGGAFVRFDHRIGVYTTSVERATIWELYDEKNRYAIRARPTRAALSHDARLIAFCLGDDWIVLDITPDPEARYPGTRPATAIGRVTTPHLAFARSGKYVALAHDAILDGAGIRAASIAGDALDRLRVDYLDSGEAIVLEPGAGALAALAFGPGDRIACLTAENRIEIMPIP